MTQSIWGTQIVQCQFNADETWIDNIGVSCLIEHQKQGQLTTENHDIWNWDDEVVQSLKTMFQSGFREWVKVQGRDPEIINDSHFQNAWAMAYEQGSFAPFHSHQLSDATAVFYPSNSEFEDLEIYDPRRVRQAMPREESIIRFQPKKGLLLVFPGYLWHRVPPYKGKEPRLCIVANLNYSRKLI